RRRPNGRITLFHKADRSRIYKTGQLDLLTTCNSTELFDTFSRNHLNICRPLITIAISQTNCSNAPLAWRVREQGHGDKAAMKMAAIRAVLTFPAPRVEVERVAAHLSPSPTRKQRTSGDRKAPRKIR